MSLCDWVDPDTPQEALITTTLSSDLFDPYGTYALVFSDEFNVPGREFQDGADPRWTALDKNDFTNNPLHYYSSESVRTGFSGALEIATAIDPRDDLFSLDKHMNPQYNQHKEFRSGMLQSWNKFCFTGGIVEFSVKLPGSPKVGGLWPAVWMMGNLGRATYVNSTENMWPFSTNICDNRTKHSQLISSCAGAEKVEGMPAGRGRGAPEVDLLEVMMMDGFQHPVVSTSLQVAPGVPTEKRPLIGSEPNETQTWYRALGFGENSTQNKYFYGTTSYPNDVHKKPYRTDSISTNSNLDGDFYSAYRTFRVEWEPPMEDGYGGYLKWFIDGKFITSVYGNDMMETSQTEIPSEAMYLLMNVAVSKDWGFPDPWNPFLDLKKCWSCFDPDCAMPKGFCNNLPTTLDIDWVRVYQPVNGGEGRFSLGCSPPDRPTKEYIEAHKAKYMLLTDEAPLLEVEIGGGECITSEDCGTETRGFCSRDSRCTCHRHWTGPHCLAHAGEYDMREDSSWKYADPKVSWPHVVVLVVAAIVLRHLYMQLIDAFTRGSLMKVGPTVALSIRASLRACEEGGMEARGDSPLLSHHSYQMGSYSAVDCDQDLQH